MITLLLLAAIAAVRLLSVVPQMPVHNDERHYALDGLWARADLPPAKRWRVLVYEHVRPHPFFNPKTGEIATHGEFEEGYRRADDDLGLVARSGHPGLHPLIVSALFAPFSTEWLVEHDRGVYLVRRLHVLLDLGTILLVVAMLRRTAGERTARAIGCGLALLPFSMIYGSMAYLDAPSTFFAALAAWWYVRVARESCTVRSWAVLGGLAALAALVKQSSVVVVALLPALAVALPPRVKGVGALARRGAAGFAACVLCFVLLCNPVGLYEELRNPVMKETRVQLTWKRAQRNLGFVFRPKEHYHVGVERHPQIEVPIDSVWLTRAYEITTPVFFAAFGLMGLVLLLRGNWEVSLLLGGLLAFAAFVPMGSVARRVYVLVPFVGLVIGWGVAQLARWRPRVLGAGTRRGG